MSRYLDQLPPTDSPWGGCDSAREPIKGVWRVSTPSHGGYMLTPERNAQIPAIARDSHGLYEEDCDWSIPAWVFRDEFLAHDKDFPVERAKAILLHWHPDAYLDLTGEHPSPDSLILKRRASVSRLIGKSVIRSARMPRGDAEDHITGSVIVAASTVLNMGADDWPVYDERSTAEWLIPSEQYDARPLPFCAVCEFAGASPYNPPAYA